MIHTTNNYAIAAILCLQTACNCAIQTVGQYIYAYYLQIYPQSSNATQHLTKFIISSDHRFRINNDLWKLCTENDSFCNASTDNAQLWAQEQSANLFFQINLWNSGPLIIMTYILGLYTPKLGRRLVLIIPMLGITSQLIIWLSIIYFHLADYWWYIASFIAGLSGSTYVLNFVMNLIIIDSTKEDNRSSRFVFFEALTTIISAGVTFGSGYYIHWRGFTDLYWISLGSQIVSIIVASLFIKNISTIVDENTSLLSSSIKNNNNIEIKPACSLRTKWKVFFIVFNIFGIKNGSYRRSICLILILLAYIFYLLAYSTYSSFLWYLLDEPFCWSSESIGNYLALSCILSGILSLLGMKFFRYIGANDILMCMFSHICFATSSVWIAFAKHSWQLYAGLLVAPYSDYQNPLTISMISKLLDLKEHNHAFTLVAEVTTIITCFGDSIFNWIYEQTVANFRNFTLLMAAGFSIFSFILNLCLLMTTRRMLHDNQVFISESEPLILGNNQNIMHTGDIICPSALYSTSFPHTSNQNSFLNDVQLSIIENETITTENHVII